MIAASTYLFTGVSLSGVAVLGFLSRSSCSISDLVSELDEELIQHVVWMANGPKRDEIMAFEIMDAIGGRGGLVHLLQQARLMTGITAEAKKDGVPESVVATMRRKRRALWRVGLLCMLLPRAHAHRLAKLFSEMAETLEDILIAVDGVGRVQFD